MGNGGVSMTVDGLEEILANLNDIPDAVKTNLLQLMSDTLDVAKGVADDGCPVDTGHLREGNDIEVSQDESGVVTGTLFNDVDYAPDVIFGTRYQAAQDFFTPALQAGADYLSQNAQNVLESNN